jgi:hypothetical protein
MIPHGRARLVSNADPVSVYIHEGFAEGEFVVMRGARDALLGMPGLILPRVQVQMRNGHLPEPEENGVRYLKIPVDQL